MKIKAPLIIGLVMAAMSTTHTFAAGSDYDTSYWSNNDGGVFNIPAEEFNPTYHGYGSTGLTVYNKIDLQTGQPMEIAADSKLYDNQGNLLATAKASKIGFHDGVRDGGIIAGATTKLRIDGSLRRVVYVWSVNVIGGGRTSGWTDLANLSPKDDIEDILIATKAARIAIIRGDTKQGNYVAKTVKAVYLPSYAAEYYVTANRNASKSAGKAKYYFTRGGLISGLLNIPETSRQRYGVAQDVAPIGAIFYWDKRVPSYELDIYPPSSSTPISVKLELVWGYFRNNSGRKMYSWVNAKALN